MDQHYFIGIPIPNHFKTLVEEIQTKYQLKDYYKSIPYIEDLHITLLFIGAFPENKVAELKEKLTLIANRHSSFILHVNGLSYFGSHEGPRVVYLTVEEHIALNGLQQDFPSEIGQLITKPISDRFTPHITIAKKWKGKDGISIEKEVFDSIEVPVDSFSLFSIHPTSVPKYEAVATYNLK